MREVWVMERSRCRKSHYFTTETTENTEGTEKKEKGANTDRELGRNANPELRPRITQIAQIKQRGFSLCFLSSSIRFIRGFRIKNGPKGGLEPFLKTAS